MATSPRHVAHQLETDAKAGAVLHVAPDDRPVVGSTSAISLELKANDPDFSPAACRCVLEVQRDGVTVAALEGPEVQQSADAYSLTYSYVFAEAGSYTLELTAVRQPGATFQEFSLEYPVEAVAANGYATGWIVAGALVAVLAVAVALARYRRKR